MERPRRLVRLLVIAEEDAVVWLQGLAEGSVDAVITDPPYSSGGMFRSDRVQDVQTKYVQTGSTSGEALTAFTGDNRDQRAYAYWSHLWMSAARRTLVPGGALLVFTDWRQLPTTTDALQAAGLIWRGIVPWHKPNGRRTAGRFANNCEYIVWGTNGPRSNEASPTLNGFFQINSPRGESRSHITQKPVELMRHLVRICPDGGLVADPFAGSGSTGVAALEEGRRFIGCEISPHFARVARDRLSVYEPTAKGALEGEDYSLFEVPAAS